MCSWSTDTYTAQEVPNVAAAMPKLTEWLRAHLKGELPIVIGHRTRLRRHALFGCPC